MNEVGPVPSVGALLYLFADDLIGPRRYGREIPCRDASVSSGPLVSLILASTFWSLRDLGLISLELRPYGPRVGKRQMKRLLVTLVEHGRLPGLAGGLLAYLGQPRGAARRVKEVVSRWYGAPQDDPDQRIVERVQRELADLGYFQTITDSRQVRSLLRPRTRVEIRTRLEPDCARIAHLWPEYQRVAARWRSFVEVEPELSRALLMSCGWVSHTKWPSRLD